MNNTNATTLATYNSSALLYEQTSPRDVTDGLQGWVDSNLAHLDKTAKILEIGSGTGKDSEYIASKGYEMELTDASQGFIDLLAQKGMNARLLNVITDNLGTDYDMVFANAVFLHFTEQELVQVLAKCHDALNEGGILAFTLKEGDGEEITTRKLGAERYFHYWQADQIKSLVKQVGFSQVTIQTGADFRGDDLPGWLYITAIC